MFERVDQSIRNDFENIVKALTGLLSIPSSKGDPLPDAPFGAETKRALDELLRLGGQMGFATRSIDNMAGFVEFGKGKKMVAALGHLDVVPPGDGWTGDPFIPVVTEDRIVARGAIDDKGPVIACLFAMKALRDAGYEPPARIRLIVGLDEESGSFCMARYTRRKSCRPPALLRMLHFRPSMRRRGSCIWFSVWRNRLCCTVPAGRSPYRFVAVIARTWFPPGAQ
jgi:succinyl-diaminopimelate desuccinylase